jgi:transposase
MLHVGMDVHWKTTTVCILDEDGHLVKSRRIEGRWDKVMQFVETIDRPFQVAFEASCGYGYLYDRLSKCARRVVVAHPGQLRLIFRSKRKNDRVDAEKLAKLLYLDEVPPAYVPSASTRRWRELIEYRQALVAKMVRCKNGLRALLRSRGISGPRGLWSRKGLEWLGSVELSDSVQLRRDMLMEELELYDRQIKQATKVLDEMGKAHPGVTVLRTIPGVGPRTAEALAAYVDDPRRFGNNRAIGAYLGLVPCQDASAGANRLGHVTREGPATARKLLVEASWQVIRRCPEMRARFERICQDRRDRRKKAVVAVARHLACCMLSMLQTGEAWRRSA